jgi:hypothetical protein
MSPTDILARAGAIFTLLFTATFMILAGVAVVRAVVPAIAQAVLFAGLTVGTALVPLVAVYLVRLALGHQASDAEHVIYMRVFIGLVALFAVVYAALMIAGRIGLST